MKSQNQKTLGLVALIVIALLCVPMMWFTLGGGNSVSTGWKTSPRINDAGIYEGESVIYEVEGKVAAIYLNIGDVYNANEKGELDFTIDYRSSASSIIDDDYISGLRKKFSIPADESRHYGWVKLCDGLSIGEKYIKLTTEQSFELKEVAFTDEKGNQLAMKCYGGFVRKNNSRVFAKAENDHERTFTLTADEQNSFSLSGINAINYREAEMLNSINNLLNGKGYHVSETSGPLGVELLSIGVLLIGENSFGLRLIPFIFFVATIYLVFFFAKKIFGGYLYATISAVVFLLSGIGLSLGGIGLAYAPALFFAVATLWFSHNLWCVGISERVHEWSKNVLMAMLFLTLAVLCDLTALVLLPILLIIYWIHFINSSKNYTKAYKVATGLEKEYARERLTKVITFGIVVFVLFFVILPLIISLLCYLIAFPSYAGFYNTQNPFAILVKDIAHQYTSANGGYFFGWILSLGSQTLSSASGQVYISTNKAFTLISTILVIAMATVLLLNRKKKLSNGELMVEIKDNYKTVLFLVGGFALCYLSMLIFVGKNEYHTMAYLSVIASLAVTCFAKLIRNNLSDKTNRAIAIFLVAIVTLFFAAQVVTFLQIPIDATVAKYLYGWMM